MKATFAKPMSIFAILVLAVFFSLTPGCARQSVSAMNRGCIEQEPSVVLSGSNYAEALNVLFGAEGR